MSENQPEELADRARRTGELAEDAVQDEESRPVDQKAQEVAEDVRAETGGAYAEEDPGHGSS
jgi:hypothetical protein